MKPFIFLLFCLLSSSVFGSDLENGKKLKVKSVINYKSHCTASELVVFHCLLGNKVASVCASTDLGKNVGYLQYRFGAEGKPEIEVPGRNLIDRKFVSFARTSSMNGGYASYTSFRVGQYQYFAYAGSIRADNHPKTGVSMWREEEGVVVMKNNQRIYQGVCKSHGYDNGIGVDFLGNPVEEWKLDSNEIDPFEIAFP